MPTNRLFLAFKSFANRLVNPKRWGLQIRVVYTTGFILLAGTFTTLFTISYVLHDSSKTSIENRIEDFKGLIDREAEMLESQLLTLNTYLASREELRQALATHEVQLLHDITKNIEDGIRFSTGKRLPMLQFYSPGATALFNSRNLSLPGIPNRTTFDMIHSAEENLSQICGIQLITQIPHYSCVLPIFVEDVPIGVLESSIALQDHFTTVVLPLEFGLSVSAPQTNVSEEPDVSTFSPLNFGKIDPLLLTDFSNRSIVSTGTVYAKHFPMTDWQQKTFADITLFYDGREIIRKSRVMIISMTCITIIGVVLLSLSLYWNVRNIRNFLNQMKGVLIASHAKDFTERFPFNAIQCSKLLNCSHKECHCFENPETICYLETGDKAISPRLRNTCFFLNKYDNCVNCPVYKNQFGSEMVEMKHVVNTVMGSWETFLDKVGKLLSDVFRTTSGQMPSLEDISYYLGQMAALTRYSHDLHGVYSKEEVYRLLEWIFEKHFSLTNFNLLEVNSSNNKMSVVINRQDIETSHREVFINCDLCRAKRVAEDVISLNNPYLCPYFGIGSTDDIRCCIPMVMGGQVGAIFTFVVNRTIWEAKENEIPIMKKYLDETAPILSSLKLLQLSKERALRDPLTNCHNRRFMDEFLIQLEHQNSRKPQKLGFIMADIDHFKMVNDEFGHLAGDEVLKQFSVILKQNIRKSDLLIRYGGEEFLVMLLDIKDENSTITIAEKLRTAVQDAKFVLPAGGIIKKTVSIGTADFPKDADHYYQTIKYADVALYQAKDQGRNKVLSFEKQMWVDDSY